MGGAFYFIMSKDFHFPFYSKEFYEGTRTMLPEERACYIDLLIYQHQNGIIPVDIRRVLMYCGGIDEATLKATLKAKFKHTDKGYYNEKMRSLINERNQYSESQSENGRAGQFFKKAKSILNKSKYAKLREFVYSNYNNRTLCIELDKHEGKHEALLKAWLKHLNNEGEDEDESKNEIIIPTYEEFYNYAQEKINTLSFRVSDDAIRLKYDSWIENDWCTGGKEYHKIKRWKSTLLNTLKYMKEHGTNKTSDWQNDFIAD